MPTLYGINGSPFVRKVRVVLAEKGVAYDHDPVMPGNPDPEYRKISPLGRIPAWRDGDHAFSDSSVICQYLERLHPEPAFYPEDPYDFARSLWFEEYADTALIEIIGPRIFFPRVVGKRFMGKEPDEEAIQKAIDEDLPPRLDYLEGAAARRPVPGRRPLDDRRRRRREHVRQPAPRRRAGRRCALAQARQVRGDAPRAAVVRADHPGGEGLLRRGLKQRLRVGN